MTAASTTGRTAELLEAALAEFVENGYATVGVREITARAGVSHGTFYNYFDNKRHMLSVLVDRFTAALYRSMTDVLERLEEPVTVGSLESAVYEASLAVLAEVAGRVDVYRFLFLEVPGVDADAFTQYLDLFRAAAEQIRAALDRARKADLINESLDPVFVSEAWLGYVAGVVAGMVNEVDTSTPQESARAITGLLLYGALS